MVSKSRADVTNELLFETLKSVQESNSSFAESLFEITGRLGTLEQQYANISIRADRIDRRLERIEARLNLHDA